MICTCIFPLTIRTIKQIKTLHFIFDKVLTPMPDRSPAGPQTFKILILGDTNVGKSSLFLRYLKDDFKEAIANTIAISNDFKEVLVDGNLVHLQMWDTAGQERFKSIVSQLYRDADGVILVYDVTAPRSFSEVKNLIAELESILDPRFTVLVGNKIDRAEKEQLEDEKSILKDLANKTKFEYFFTSAKTGENVNKIFEHLSRSLYYNKKPKKKMKNLLSQISKQRRRFCF
jgi:small GTP-binding protein